MNAMKELEKLMEENKDVLIRLKEGEENKSMIAWKVNADVVEKDYGSYVNREDNFYICPECSEPVYACDWTDEELVNVICPICGFDESEEL